ncbi:MAG: hypothetical protein ACXACR_17080 [Candidatus Hodarchaeales archaeon]|jgi:hypothetical protein
MTKIFEVKPRDIFDCHECGNFVFDWERLNGYCLAAKSIIYDGEWNNIPKWCPLPDKRY